MAQPPGCSFLGLRTTQVPVTVNSVTGAASTVIIDSGSDITLISHKLLSELSPAPKWKTGQKVNLVQVTGNATISGFVNLDLFFHTPESTFKINIDAYAVKGMTTPIILGNDFADQYSLSLIRAEGNTYLELGDSGCKIQVENSTSETLVDEDGHAFRIKVNQNPGLASKKVTHRRNQRFKKKQ